MNKFDLFTEIRSRGRKSDPAIDNLLALGFPEDTRSIHILWMYPDVLDMHGDRGNAMALLHYSNLLGLPCTIRKCVHLTDEIPFDWADLMLFPCGDIACMEDVSNALRQWKQQFEAYAARGGLLYAIGSSGSILAKKTTMLDGHAYEGLGLLNMEMTQRNTVFGDDLWVETHGGLGVMGNEIQVADTTLGSGQAPFAQVRYGRGNCGGADEGAQTGSVVFTHLTGPVFAKNPDFTQAVLKDCARLAGIPAENELNREDVALELASLQDIETFVRSKMQG